MQKLHFTRATAFHQAISDVSLRFLQLCTMESNIESAKDTLLLIAYIHNFPKESIILQIVKKIVKTVEINKKIMTMLEAEAFVLFH